MKKSIAFLSNTNFFPWVLILIFTSLSAPEQVFSLDEEEGEEKSIQLRTPEEKPQGQPDFDDSADAQNDESDENEDSDLYEDLPGIEARTYATSIRKLSKSKRVYLLNDLDARKPREGRILLLRKENKNSMAFKILKIYPDREIFAARKVREYHGIKNLTVGGDYIAIEKISDLFSKTSREDQQKDDYDLQELEEGFDGENENDRDNEEKYDEENEEKNDDDAVDRQQVLSDSEFDDISQSGLQLSDIMLQEINPIDNDDNWLSFSLASFVTRGTAGTQYLTGVGLRYAYTVSKMLWIREADIQDSLAIEFGTFFYNVVNLTGKNDDYTVAPLLGAFRYNAYFSEGFLGFVHLGMKYNYILDSTGATDDGLIQIGNFGLAAGGGLMFRIGPKWHIRVDLGAELLGGGLVLRF